MIDFAIIVSYFLRNKKWLLFLNPDPDMKNVFTVASRIRIQRPKSYQSWIFIFIRLLNSCLFSAVPFPPSNKLTQAEVFNSRTNKPLPEVRHFIHRSKTLGQTTQYRKTNHWPILLKLWRSSFFPKIHPIGNRQLPYVYIPLYYCRTWIQS